MNKDRRSRQRCILCANCRKLTESKKGLIYTCILSLDKRMDKHTRQPDWCRKRLNEKRSYLSTNKKIFDVRLNGDLLAKEAMLE